jgi:hypothetical protein
MARVSIAGEVGARLSDLSLRRQQLRRKPRNADVVSQERAVELGIVASLRSVQRALTPYLR